MYLTYPVFATEVFVNGPAICDVNSSARLRGLCKHYCPLIGAEKSDARSNCYGCFSGLFEEDCFKSNYESALNSGLRERLVRNYQDLIAEVEKRYPEESPEVDEIQEVFRENKSSIKYWVFLPFILALVGMSLLFCCCVGLCCVVLKPRSTFSAQPAPRRPGTDIRVLYQILCSYIYTR